MACLPLLKDEGLSIRRQAARAIGSRFAEIPEGERKQYVEALKQCAKEGPADIALMCERGIGLLAGSYKSEYFCVGPRRKWVLYERHKLPVVGRVDGGEPHRLLSPVVVRNDGSVDLLKLEVTNEKAVDLFGPHWHPGGTALAFTPVLQRKFYHPVCVWWEGRETVTVLDPAAFKGLLPKRYPAWGTTSEFVRWEGDRAIVRIYDCDRLDGKEIKDEGVLAYYDFRSGVKGRVER